MADNLGQERRRKYRLALLDDRTLREVFHLRLSGLGAVIVLSLLFVVLLALLSALIIYTPVRNILPGYSADIRQQLITETARLDSLQNDLALQRQYLDVIKQLTAGDIQSDSVQSLDSLQIVQRTQLLEVRNEATEAFVAQYEAREQDNLLIFTAASSTANLSLIRPVRGVVLQSARPEKKEYAVRLRVPEKESVLAVQQGSVVFAQRELDNSYTLVLQHPQYVSVYRHVSTLLKGVGAQVEAGEAVGLMSGETDLEFELWKAGEPVNPEELIAF